MVEYFYNRNRITHAIENAEFTHKLSKVMVYCYETIPTQEIRESWSLQRIRVWSLLPI